VLHGGLESRVPSLDLWKYNNYYSEAAIAARNPHSAQVKTGANVSRKGSTPNNKRISGGESSALVTTGQKEGGKIRGKAVTGGAGGRKIGLGGKGGKAIVMPKGCVSEEVLFGTIALLAEALGVHTMNALLIAGKKDDGGDVDGEREDESMSALDKIFRFGLNTYLCASLHVVVKAMPRILTGVQGERFSLSWDYESLMTLG
jgi:hypothetical protein